MCIFFSNKCFPFFLHKHAHMTWPDLFLISRSTSTPVYIWAAPIYSPTFSPQVGQPLIFVFLMMIAIRQVWDSISSWFWFTFPWWLLILNILMFLLSICISYENVFWGPSPIFKLRLFFMLSCANSLYILDINHLTERLLANIFSHSVGCLFVLLTFSFGAQKFCFYFFLFLFIFIFLILFYF